MTQRVILLALLCVPIASNCNADLTSAEKDSITAGISSGTQVVESLASFGDPKTSKIFQSIGRMASFLGAAGGFVSFVLAFLPSRESAELAYMKKQFTLVNTKLDKITTELDDMKSLITFQNQRSAYISSSHAILSGHKQLMSFIDEVQNSPCSSKSACKRIRSRIASRFVEYFNVKQHLDNIVLGTFSNGTVFGDPLLSLVSTAFKCNFAKINWFVNGVLKLAFKGQQVILAYEQLVGSKQSITMSMNNWLTNIDRLRTESYIVKNKCFKNMKHHLLEDIRNSDYQIRSPSNAAANKAVKSFLEKKYPWLNVVVFSYNAYGSSEHCNSDVYGGLWSMPSNKNSRKRNIFAGIADKAGTYLNQKGLVLTALNGIAKHVDFDNERGDYCKVIKKLRKELQKRNIWKYVSSLSIRKENAGLHIQADNDLKYIDKFYQLSLRSRRGIWFWRGSISAHVVLVLKSMEQVNAGRCELACTNGGECKRYPYSNSQYCQCKPFYQGNLCEKHSKAQFAKTIDSMLAVTLELPVLSDVYFDIKDLRRFVGVSFANLQKSISNLESTMQRKVNQLSGEMKDNFKWAKFTTMYRTAIQTIEYYSHRFERLPKEHMDEETLERYGRRLSTSVLNDHHGIRKALYQLNNLLVGKADKPLLQHKPILLAFMESRSKAAEPCTLSYKNRVDNYWRQLLLLQQIGYMVWVQALEFANRKSIYVSNVYQSRLAEQLNAIKIGTCKYDIRHSANIHCNKHYLHPGMTIRNRCVSGYYVNGSLQTSCTRKYSSCLACNCSRYGSKSEQCNDISGKCNCEPGFKGYKCHGRDCVWSKWSPFTACSCSYNSRKVATRRVMVERLGNGKRCSGNSTKFENCGQTCCSNQFACHGKEKCIDASYKCDYDNDCGDNEDERSCNEQCVKRYTNWNEHGDGKLVYLDRQDLSCHNREQLQMFHMETSGSKIRYQYICCKLNKAVCNSTMNYNEYTYAVFSSPAQYLDRQRVSCGIAGYISSFRVRRSSNHKAIRYEYNCCHLNYLKHWMRSSCYNGYTTWTADGNGKNYYLDRQTVRCDARYFINGFRLEHNREMSMFRYHYRCCRIKS